MTMKEMRYEGSRANGGEGVMVVVRHLSLLSHFPFSLSPLEATRNLGRPVVRSVVRSVALARRLAGPDFTQIRLNSVTVTTVTMSPCHILSTLQPAHNLSQELLYPLLSPLNRIEPSFPLQASQHRLLLFRLSRRFRFKQQIRTLIRTLRYHITLSARLKHPL